MRLAERDKRVLYRMEKTEEDGPEGGTITVWKVTGSFKGAVQPVSGGLVQEEYGLHEEVSERLFLPRGISVSQGEYLAFTASADRPDRVVVYAQTWRHNEALLSKQVK